MKANRLITSPAIRNRIAQPTFAKGDTAVPALVTRTCNLKRTAIAVLLAGGLAAGCSQQRATATADPNVAQAPPAAAAASVNRVLDNTSTAEWPSYGLNYAETRFSKLRQITDGNVADLGLVWTYDLKSTRGVQATPLVIDGVMYVTGSWSIVHALDVRTGKARWTFDPKVPGETGNKACCDVVNRGVAYHNGKIFVGALDGRLIALDAATGAKLWEQDTLEPAAKAAATITGAPRVFKGKVIIGNGGSELGLRGYITAYDADTGKQAWRFHTVPGDPSKPYENAAMEMAAKTWDPAGKYWEAGGGGTVWNSMVYDPELDLMYIGVGNGAPWSQAMRSPAGGDNLFLTSIVALRPDTGEYVWHYQGTPGDNWDYTATQDIILADLDIKGEKRKVLMQAPKSGFFFVVDRETGKFISAENFVEVNWATGFDPDGRPIENPMARRTDQPVEVIPTVFGAHNWHSMSFNPELGLAYIPAQGVPVTLQDDLNWSGPSDNKPGQPMSGVGWNTAKFVNAEPPKALPFGRLIAWDPVAQKEVWRQEHISPWNGGTLTTAGNLVFQGTADARFVAYNARTGEKLWSTATGTGVVAAPMTYEIDGTQYVSIAVGWGGVFGLSARASDLQMPGTVYTFALGGNAEPPKLVEYQLGNLIEGVAYDPADVPEGTALYVSNCVFCHGVPGVDKGGNLPNLAYRPKAVIENLEAMLFNGPFTDRGMPDFTGKLTTDDVRKIQAFIQGTADAVRPAP